MAEQLGRRDLLKGLGLAGVSLLAMPALMRVLGVQRDLLAEQTGRAVANATLIALTPAEFSALDAICARLIPSDENGPGAREAGAARYIDRALGGALSAFLDDYSVGLAAVNVYARMKEFSAKAFSDLSAAQQDEVLRDMEQDAPLGFMPSSAAFFNLIRSHTLQGTFCDPIYGGNANLVGWDLLGYPGVRLSVTPAEQNMSTPAGRNHKSAYDYLMFSRIGTV